MGPHYTNLLAGLMSLLLPVTDVEARASDLFTRSKLCRACLFHFKENKYLQALSLRKGPPMNLKQYPPPVFCHSLPITHSVSFMLALSALLCCTHARPVLIPAWDVCLCVPWIWIAPYLATTGCFLTSFKS